MTSGKFGGIGSVIRYYDARKRVAIVEPSEGNPAAEHGLKAGDIIIQSVSRVESTCFKKSTTVPSSIFIFLSYMFTVLYHTVFCL